MECMSTAGFLAGVFQENGDGLAEWLLVRDDEKDQNSAFVSD